MADDEAPANEPASPAALLREGESIVFKDPDAVSDAAAPAEPDVPAADEEAGGAGDDGLGMDDDRPEQFDVHYTCLRCGTDVSNEELGRLPEIKCICGYKVFIKVRPPIVKTVRAV